MQYIIMCGGDYTDYWKTPKPLLEINGEKLVERTIRLLKENGVKDIAISTNDKAYDYLSVKKLHHKNDYIHTYYADFKKSDRAWLNAYYPTNEPACYLHGDVYFTDEAIEKIVNAEVKDALFICTRWTMKEPLGYKVVNQEKFRKAINDLLRMIDEGRFAKDPISWNLYRKLNGLKLIYNGYGNDIFETNGEFLEIKDFTNDIDYEKDIPIIMKNIREYNLRKGDYKMVRVRAIKDFNFNEKMFNQTSEITRAHAENNEKFKFYNGDTFVCSKEIALYLENKLDREFNPGENPMGYPLVEHIEVIPEEAKEKKSAAKEKEDADVPVKKVKRGKKSAK